MLSCNNDNDTQEENEPNAKVLRIGEDCGNSYLIQLNDNNIPSNSTNNIFYEINLPEEFKMNDLEININFRLPNDNEIMNCTGQGITYPQIYIESVN